LLLQMAAWGGGVNAGAGVAVVDSHLSRREETTRPVLSARKDTSARNFDRR
jgi:hypothetical protein